MGKKTCAQFFFFRKTDPHWRLHQLTSTQIKPIGYLYKETSHTLGVINLYFSAKNDDVDLAQAFFKALELSSSAQEKEKGLIKTPHIGLSGQEWLLNIDLASNPACLTSKIICELMLMFDENIYPCGTNLKQMKNSTPLKYIENVSDLTNNADSLANDQFALMIYYQNNLLADLAAGFLRNITNTTQVSKHTNPYGKNEYIITVDLNEMHLMNEVHFKKITKALKLILTTEQNDNIEKVFSTLRECIGPKSAVEQKPSTSCCAL